MRYDYDLVVIGGGSGGLVAARLARELGAKVALVDKERLGGECLYSGCVPSKTLIHIARIAHQYRLGNRQGVNSATPIVDMPRVAATIAGVIDQIGQLEEAYVQGVTVRFGTGGFTDPHSFQIDGTMLTSKSFIIATGSHAALPAIPGIQEAGYLTNDDVFDLDRLPSSLVVVGGGPVGCELSQAFARLGSQVTLMQRGERLLPKEDPEVSLAVQAALEADGVRVLLRTRPERMARQGEQRSVTYTSIDGAPATIPTDAVLIATGREPNTDGLGLELAGVNVTANGIPVDTKLRTSAANIAAIGDVIGNYRFTHVAAAEAGVAAPNMLLPPWLGRTMRYDVVPWVTFTDPEAARVGLTEAEARSRPGTAIRTLTLPFAAIDRAQTEGATTGFIKLILGSRDKILGAHIVGAHAGEMLAEVTLAMRHGLTVNDIIATIHAYPTFATGVQQAAFEAYLSGKSFMRARGIVQRFLPKH